MTNAEFLEIMNCNDPAELDKAAIDLLATGTGAMLVKPDGSCEHIPVRDLYAETGTPPASRARAHLPTRILAIDPGTTESGWCVYADGVASLSGVMGNAEVIELLKCNTNPRDYTLAIEMIASYGMAVGREVFETCVWIGRFVQAWHSPDAVRLVYRRDVKLHLCGSPKAKDANIRQALLDMFPRTGGGKTPQIGTKSQPGPLYGVSSHAWAALGVAVTALAQIEGERA